MEKFHWIRWLKRATGRMEILSYLFKLIFTVCLARHSAIDLAAIWFRGEETNFLRTKTFRFAFSKLCAPILFRSSNQSYEANEQGKRTIKSCPNKLTNTFSCWQFMTVGESSCSVSFPRKVSKCHELYVLTAKHFSFEQHNKFQFITFLAFGSAEGTTNDPTSERLRIVFCIDRAKVSVLNCKSRKSNNLFVSGRERRNIKKSSI